MPTTIDVPRCDRCCPEIPGVEPCSLNGSTLLPRIVRGTIVNAFTENVQDWPDRPENYIGLYCKMQLLQNPPSTDFYAAWHTDYWRQDHHPNLEDAHCLEDGHYNTSFSPAGIYCTEDELTGCFESQIEDWRFRVRNSGLNIINLIRGCGIGFSFGAANWSASLSLVTARMRHQVVPEGGPDAPRFCQYADEVNSLAGEFNTGFFDTDTLCEFAADSVRRDWTMIFAGLPLFTLRLSPSA